MDSSGLVLIAKTASVFGLKGQIKAYMLAEDKAAYLGLSSVHLGHLEDLSTFEVAKVFLKRQHLILTLVGINSVDEAIKFSGGFVYCDIESWPDVTVGQVSYSSLKGLAGFDKTGKKIGQIVDLTNNNGQYLLVMENDQAKKFLIPWHEHVLIEKTATAVFFDLPAGLLDI